MSDAGQRLFDLSVANCLEPSGSNSDEQLDIPSFHDTSYNHTAPLGSLDLSSISASQHEYFTYETDNLGTNLDAINENSLEFNIETPAPQLQYINSRSDTTYGNVLDDVPRDNVEYREAMSFSSNRLFSPDFTTNSQKFPQSSDNSIEYSSYQDSQLNAALAKPSERVRHEAEGDQCHLNEYFDGVHPYDSYTVHCQVVKTITRELEYETKFQNGELDLEDRPARKKRRKPNEVNWRPESVFRSYVDCKPADIHKTSYPDHVPMSSCFGRINMREAKAWSRQPNKPKRQRIKKEENIKAYNRGPGNPNLNSLPKIKDESTDFFVICSMFP